MRLDAFTLICQRLRAQALYAPSLYELKAGSVVPDTSGLGRDGTLKNGAAYSASGIIDGAIAAALDGANDYIASGLSTRTNLLRAPTGEGVSLWGAPAGSAVAVGEGTGKVSGRQPIRITRTAEGEGFATAWSPNITVVPGQLLTVSAYLKAVSKAGVQLEIGIDWKKTGGTYISSSAFKVEDASGRASVVAAVAPAEAGEATVVIESHGKLATGGWIEFDAVLAEQSGSLGSYFPTAAQLESGEAAWSGTSGKSEADVGPFIRGGDRSFVLALNPSSGNTSVVWSGPVGGNVYAYISNSNNLHITFDNEATQWVRAIGTGGPAIWVVVVSGTSMTVYENGVSLGTQTISRTAAVAGAMSLGGEASEATTNNFTGSLLPFAYFNRALTEAQAAEISAAAGFAPRPIPLPSEAPDLTVVSIAGGGTGRGYNLTEDAEGLSYSNINPGGDEVCSFTLRRKWYEDNPEIARGNLLRIMCGVDVVWQGRIEESDRSADSTETIAVTAYGLGVRLKDGSFREIFIDSDLSKWGEPSTQRKIAVLGAGFEYGHTSVAEASPQDAGAAGPGFLIHIDAWLETPHPIAELWYFGAGVDLGGVLFDFIVPKPSGTESLVHQMNIVEDDGGGGLKAQSEIFKNAAKSNQVLLASAAGGKYAYFQFRWELTGSGTNGGDTWGYTNLKVEGTHGLFLAGTWPHVGFTVDQMVGYIVGLVEGVNARRIDPQTFVVEQASFTDATTNHEDGIRDLNRYENCDWGTWGPASPLDRSTSGYFDFTTPDRETQHWFVLRSEADAEDLHSETATLYGKVAVVYTDEAGIERVVYVETDVPDLDAAGMTREYTLNIGQATEAIATAEGEAFLAIWGQFAPARGSFTVSQAVRHYRRGELSPVYMRADGSNVRIPDILPASTLFALDSTPDRRTTFPIKRVTVDCSGALPAATVEVDQADDSLSVLQARADTANALIPA